MKRSVSVLVVGLVGLALAPVRDAHAGCTTLSFAADSGPVFAANLDQPTPTTGLVLVNRRGVAKKNIRAGEGGTRAKWVSKYGSVTLSLVGRGFAWSGMNEAGLVVTSTELRSAEYPHADARAPFDIGSWIQYALDTAGSVQEVIRLDASVRLIANGTPPGHFFVADGRGDAAALEYQDGKPLVYTGKNLPVRAMANMPYARAVEALERGGTRWWWSNPGRSAERVATAAARIASFESNPRQDPIEHAFATLVQVADGSTRWSVVFDIGKREVWFRSTTSPATKHLSFADLDFACAAQLQMLDVDAAVSGEAAKALVPYDRAVNLEFFRKGCSRGGIRVSSEAAMGLMQLFETFECAQ